MKSIHIKWRKINVLTLFQWECSTRQSLFALTQDVESLIYRKKIHHHEMFECLHQSILCPAQGCKFINNMETVILHSIIWPFHLLYCAFCKSLCNVSILTHDCNVIKSQRSIPSMFKYYHENPPTNHFHKDVFLCNHSYSETFEDRGKINNDMFMSVALANPPSTSVLTRRILQRQNAVENLSVSTSYNNTDWSPIRFYLLLLLFI